jgi:hypothetical protein
LPELCVKSFSLGDIRDGNEAMQQALFLFFQRFDQEDYLGCHPVVQSGELARVKVAAAGRAIHFCADATEANLGGRPNG